MALATRPWQPVRGSLWVQEYPYCHQTMTQTHPKAVGTFSENVNFSKFFQVPAHNCISAQSPSCPSQNPHNGSSNKTFRLEIEKLKKMIFGSKNEGIKNFNPRPTPKRRRTGGLRGQNGENSSRDHSASQNDGFTLGETSDLILS